MKKTNYGYDSTVSPIPPISVDTKGLQNILRCGRSTAVQIGTAAEAKIMIGKRVLWNIAKIQEYLNCISTM